MSRSKEIHSLVQLTPEQVIENAGDHLEVCENLDELHRHFAEYIFEEIE